MKAPKQVVYNKLSKSLTQFVASNRQIGNATVISSLPAIAHRAIPAISKMEKKL